MPGRPLVSVLTPTWQRPALELLTDAADLAALESVG
jgi:hypothetical protein